MVNRILNIERLKLEPRFKRICELVGKKIVGIEIFDKGMENYYIIHFEDKTQICLPENFTLIEPDNFEFSNDRWDR